MIHDRSLLVSGVLIAGCAFVLGQQMASVGTTASAAQPAEEPGMDGVMSELDPSAFDVRTPMHDHLTRMAGKWDGKLRMRVTPDSPWMEMKGSADREIVLNGLFLIERVSADVMGFPFEAIAIVGYNTDTEKYESVWIENAATHMSHSSGTHDEAKGAFYMWGTRKDPETRKEIKSMGEIDCSRDGVDVYRSYTFDPDGTKHLVFEGTFTKQ